MKYNRTIPKSSPVNFKYIFKLLLVIAVVLMLSSMFLSVNKINTPRKSSRLDASEQIESVSGDKTANNADSHATDEELAQSVSEPNAALLQAMDQVTSLTDDQTQSDEVSQASSAIGGEPNDGNQIRDVAAGVNGDQGSEANKNSSGNFNEYDNLVVNITGEDMRHVSVVEHFMKLKENVSLSELGKYLFLKTSPSPRLNKTFKILIWKYGHFLERRHIRFFTNKSHDPFESCSVKNCNITYEDNALEDADAVVFLMLWIKSVDQLPDFKKPRPKNQRWVFLTDESPHNTFWEKNNNSWTNYQGIFNWSMTYRMESDVPVPYGRTSSLDTSIPAFVGETLPHVPSNIMALVPNSQQKQRDVLVAIMTSNCNHRMQYIKELQKYMEVDVYGGCGTKLKKACPGHFSNDCPKLNRYLFYLAFENSDCNEYSTEKLFWSSYNKGSVPIVMGSTPHICNITLPPNSFLHVRDYARPQDLARHVLMLNETWDEGFFKLHQWRRDFEVLNEHAYFASRSFHYCRLCEALNYNDEAPKVYEDLSSMLSVEKNCLKHIVINEDGL